MGLSGPVIGVYFATQIVQTVHGHVFECGVTLRRTLGWRFAELIGMIFRAKKGRAIPNAVVAAVVAFTNQCIHGEGSNRWSCEVNIH